MTRNKHIIVLFYVNLTLITLVNIILIYGLFSHLVLRQQVEQIDWLIGVFSAEVLVLFGFGWKKIFSSEIRPIIFLDEPKPFVVPDKNGTGKPFVSVDAEGSEDPNNPNEIIRRKGLSELKEMQKSSPSSSNHKKFGKEAKNTFSKLPKTGIYHHISLLNTGTVERELGNYSKALSYYEQAQEVLREIELSQLELQKRLSITEMMIGNVFDCQKRYPEARSQFLKALKTWPNFVNTLNLFDVSENLQDVEAMETWAEILTLYDEYQDDNYKSVVKSVEQRLASHRQKSSK